MLLFIKKFVWLVFLLILRFILKFVDKKDKECVILVCMMLMYLVLFGFNWKWGLRILEKRGFVGFNFVIKKKLRLLDE